MSALPLKGDIGGCARLMSALPPKPDMVQHGCDVRFVPRADISQLIRSSPGPYRGAFIKVWYWLDNLLAGMGAEIIVCAP
jgi:hypothetical protein